MNLFMFIFVIALDRIHALRVSRGVTNTETVKTVSASPDKEARRAQLREVAQRVAKMSEDERAALAARVSVTTIEGRGLSLHNQCLLALQIPAATIVGCFR